MVSLSVSPLLWLVFDASEKPMTFAPRRLMAVSKLSRVLVDGSKKRLAITLPSRNFCSLFFSNSLAVSSTCRIYSFVKSLIEIKLFLLICGMLNFIYIASVHVLHPFEECLDQ